MKKMLVLVTFSLVSMLVLGALGYGWSASLAGLHVRDFVPPPTEWDRTYGGVDIDRIHSVLEIAVGGYLLAGETMSSGAGYGDVWLVEVDSSGNVQWSKTYGGAEADRAYSVVATIDNGYALAGSTGSFGAGNYDFWLVKVDSSGNAQWNKTYGGSGNDIAYSLVQTSDGGYAIAGNTESYGAGGYDFWLVKVDSSGNLEWNKTYGGLHHDIARSLVQLGAAGYAIVGYTASYGAGGDDVWLIRVDSSGNAQWNKTYGGSGNDSAYSLVQTSDGGYAIAGNTKSYGAGGYDFWLIRTDATGSVQWDNTFGGSSHDIAYSLVQTNVGEYAIAGDSNSYGAGRYDFWFVKTDSSGNAEWNQTYGGTNNDVAKSVVQTSDGGYAIAGYTASYGAGYDDGWLIKVEAEDGAEVHDLAVTGVTPSKTIVGAGNMLYINVTVANQGTQPETFDVNVYANTTIIGTQTTVLENGNYATVTFTWNTTVTPHGNYTIKGVADAVPGETDTLDNVFVDGSVFVTILGDFDGDGDVDEYDLTRIREAYGSTPSAPNWDAPCDINRDDIVDVFDLRLACKNYGKTT